MRDDGKHFVWQSLAEEVVFPPDFDAFGVDIALYEATHFFDSANANYSHFYELHAFIFSIQHLYEGFVIIHGTDTMVYAACTLHFLFLATDFLRPIILTGAKIPLKKPDSDALPNVLGALRVLTAIVSSQRATPSPASNCVRIPRVMIFFDNVLLDGIHTTKVDSLTRHAMLSPNYPVLASCEANSVISHVQDMGQYVIAKAPYARIKTLLRALNKPCHEVCTLILFPFMGEEFFMQLLSSTNLRAVVLLTYGVGNAPYWLSKILEKNKHILFVSLSQCLYKDASLAPTYPSQRALDKAGVVAMHPHTLSFTLTLLQVILGTTDSVQENRKRLREARDFYACHLSSDAPANP